MSAMLQLNPPIWVTTPAGEGDAILVIDYGPTINSIWVVALYDSGRVLHVDSCEVKIMVGNPMWGIPQPEPFEGRNMESYGEDSK